MSFRISPSGGYVEHRLNTGRRFTGVAYPDDEYNPLKLSADGTRGLILASQGFIFPGPVNSGSSEIDGLGLFEFQILLGGGRNIQRARTYESLMVQWAHLDPGDGVSWVLAITDGLTAGTPATTIDDPSRDIVVGSGTGRAFFPISKPLTARQHIRFTTNSGVTKDDAFCRIWFSPMLQGSVQGAWAV